MNFVKITEEEKEEILEAVKKHPLSMLEASKETRFNFGKFATRAKKLGVYKPNQSHKGRVFLDGGNGSTPIQEIIEGKHPRLRSTFVKERLIQSGILENKCSECGMGDEWNGKPIVHELDHINGIRDDHRLENLRILCPNCHTQTEGFRGRGRKGNSYKFSDKDFKEVLDNSESIHDGLSKLGLKISGGNYQRARKLI